MSIADVLITRGWYQGDLEGPDGSVCMIGACLFALVAEDGNDLKYLEATDFIYRQTGEVGISRWNDDPTRTFDEVLRVAKMADEILSQ